MAKDTYYFPHDYHARHDPKLEDLRMEIGPVGDGIYWDLVEMLYEQGGYLPLKNIPLFAKVLNTTEELLEKVIKTSELFVVNGDNFYSESLIARLKHINTKRRKAIGSANKRWNAKAMPTHSEGNAIKESKVKERKVKNIKEPPEKPGPVDKSKKEGVFNDKEKAVLEQVQSKTNIYALLEEFKKAHGDYPPKDLLIRVCQQFLDKGAGINEPYPYLKAALHRAAQDEAHLELKKDTGMAQSLKNILGIRR